MYYNTSYCTVKEQYTVTQSALLQGIAYMYYFEKIFVTVKFNINVL